MDPQISFSNQSPEGFKAAQYSSSPSKGHHSLSAKQPINLAHFGACKTGFDEIAKTWFIPIYFCYVQILPVSAFPRRVLGCFVTVFLLGFGFFLEVIFTSCVIGNLLHENTKAGVLFCVLSGSYSSLSHSWASLDPSGPLTAEAHGVLVVMIGVLWASHNKAQRCQHLQQQQAWVRGQAQPTGSRMAQPDTVESLTYWISTHQINTTGPSTFLSVRTQGSSSIKSRESPFHYLGQAARGAVFILFALLCAE